MTHADIIKQADRNIRLYVILKIFTKRVFLPLSAIYFVQVDGFTLKEIGLLAAFFALVQLLAELPTGYFADRFARITSIRIGALLNIAATLLYALVHTKLAVFVGQGLEAVGYCFIAGAGEALIHDSLVAKGQTHRYSKILSHAQAIALVMNAVLIALIPMTYQLNPSLPFLLGSLAYGCLLAVSLRMADVSHEKLEHHRARPSWRGLVDKRHIISFGLLFGIVGALYTGPSDMVNLALKDFGIRPEYLGWLFAIASLFGAMMGPFIHLLRKLSITQYAFLDLVMLLSVYAGALSGSALMLSILVIINMSFWRYRKIIYQDHLLTIYPTRYKATLLSAINNIEQLNLIWLPVVIALSVAHLGYAEGLGLIGLGGLVIMPLYLISTVRAFKATS